MSNEFPSKISPIRQIPTSEELLHFRISASSVSALPKCPLFPRNLFFPRHGPVSGSFITKGQAFNHDLKIHRAV
jgi:hypothetical protein